MLKHVIWGGNRIAPFSSVFSCTNEVSWMVSAQFQMDVGVEVLLKHILHLGPVLPILLARTGVQNTQCFLQIKVKEQAALVCGAHIARAPQAMLIPGPACCLGVCSFCKAACYREHDLFFLSPSHSEPCLQKPTKPHHNMPVKALPEDREW